SIRHEMDLITESYLKEIANLHHMKPPILEDDESIILSRRRRSINDDHDHSIPFYIREGTKPLSAIVDSGKICRGSHTVLDLFVLPFEGFNYGLCLTSEPTKGYFLHYGPLPSMSYRTEITDLSNPTRILAFVHKGDSYRRSLVVLILNQKTDPKQFAVKWFQINPQHVVIHINHIKQLVDISVSNSAVFNHDLAIFHDQGVGSLQVYSFMGTYFDFEAQIPISNNLNAICTFSIYGKRYLALGFRAINPGQRPHDIMLISLDEKDLKSIQKIPVLDGDQDVLDLNFFTFGKDDGGRKQENFLVVVKRKFILFYKFIDYKPMIFQRIAMENVRKVRTYGNSESLFVMIALYETNDVQLIIYNSFRFMVSSIQRRMFLYPNTPLMFYKPLEWSNSIQLFVAAYDAIETYTYTFSHDRSLLDEWRRSMDWCRNTHNEVMNLHRRSLIIQKSFSQAYVQNEPIHVKGSLFVPSYVGDQVETRDYQQMDSDSFRLNQHYFDELFKMKTILDEIDRKIHRGHHRLSDALFMHSTNLQQVFGRHHFNNVRIVDYNTSRHGLTQSIELNLRTQFLNEHEVTSLFEDTIRLRSDQPLWLMKTPNFTRIEAKQLFRHNGLVNSHFNISDVITRDQSHTILGRKRLHHCLLVDDHIYSMTVNGQNFTQHTVLLTSIPQRILNPIQIQAPKIRTSILNARIVNKIHIKTFFDNVVMKNTQTTIMSSVEFANGLEVYDLYVNGSSRLNGHIIDELIDDVLWINQPNQTLWGEYNFNSNLHVDGNLFVERINQKSIPEDLVLANSNNLIKGIKHFEEPIFIDRLNITSVMNGLLFQNGMPDILLRNVPQNITGYKALNSLKLMGHSRLTGTINELNLEELLQRSKQRSETKYFEKLNIENVANFIGGIHFDHLNGLSRSQFEQLIHHSIGLDQTWNELELGQVRFNNLFVNTLDCRLVNGWNLDSDLLTRNTNQYVSGSMSFDTIRVEGSSTVSEVNGVPMQALESIFRTYDDQNIDKKIFANDIYVKSLQVNSINSIPFDEIVFMDQVNSKPIIGTKIFNSSKLQFDSLTVDHLHLNAINRIPVQQFLHGSLHRNTPQNVSNQIEFKSLILRPNVDFGSYWINGVNLYQLQNDMVLNYNGLNMLQNITGRKIFTDSVSFEDKIEFDRLMDGINYWEMANNWMYRGVQQRVDATMNIEHLECNQFRCLDRNVVRLDRKSVIHSNLEFVGPTQIYGGVILNGKLNDIDLRQDVVYSNYNGIQTIRGKINILNKVQVRQNLDINGYINGIDVQRMCASIYRPEPTKPLVVNGDVRIVEPIRFNVINNITYEELRTQTIRHDLPYQNVTGRMIVNTLILNNSTYLSRHINGLNLQHIKRTYFSKSKPQHIDADIVVQSDVQFIGDIDTRRFWIENGIIGGINLSYIDQNSLKVYGDQNYYGNVDFVTDVDIQLDLNSRWLNGVDTEHFMRRDRRVHSFLEETIFTRNLTVVDNLNIINGKLISGVNVEMIHQNAVQRNGHRNYTVRGRKIFDSIEVENIHTEKLNTIPISKRSLLLRTDPQTITGKISFDGNVHLNTSVIESINRIKLNRFYDSIVRRNAKSNIIDSEVKFDSLNIGTVEARALIDNVNISVLNTISDTIKNLETLEQFSSVTRNDFDQFEKRLASVPGKFLFFELFSTITEKMLYLPTIVEPLLIDEISHYLAFFLPSKMEDNCFETQVHLVDQQNVQSINLLRLFSPLPVRFVHHINSFVFITSYGSFENNSNVGKCLAKNTLSKGIDPNNIVQVYQGKSIIFFQIFRLMPERQLVSLLHLAQLPKSLTQFEMIMINDVYVLLCSENQCHLICLNCGTKVELEQIQLDGPILKIYNIQDTIIIMLPNRVDIFKRLSTENKLIHLQSISNFNSRAIHLIENQVFSYLLIGNNRKQIHVYRRANQEKTIYQRIQTIQESESIIEFKTFYGKPMIRDETFVLARMLSKIVLFQLEANDFLKKIGTVEIGNVLSNTNGLNLRQLYMVGKQQLLALYYGNDYCQPHNGQRAPFIDILRPRFHLEVTFGEERTNRGEQWEKYHRSIEESDKILNHTTLVVN
ncbi:hypothetical protein RDWZM_002130, partial [Blomia tropicalis]